MKDISLLDNLIVGRVEPHIYAFTTNTVPNYLKVGDTYRPVSVRLKEWQTYYPKLEKQFENTAKVAENAYFRDYSVHQYLESDLHKERLKPENLDGKIYYSNEFFKNTDASEVADAIADIAYDYESKGNKYKFYNPLTSMPTTVRYASTGYWEPRPNQQATINAFKKAVESGRTNLLMYAVMRFGKSFTSMCCAKEMNDGLGARLVAVVSAKADVKEEWRKTVECAENFRNDYEFLSSVDLERNHRIVTDILSKDEGINNVVLFLTLQDLQGDVIKEKHQQIFGRKVDLLIIDETHFGARAEKYGQVLKDAQFKGEKAHQKDDDDYVEITDAEEQIKIFDAKIKLHLSGTPYRILMGGEFQQEDIIAFYQFSDIVREQEAWDKENLLRDDVKEWDNPYYGFPQMIRFAFNPNESSIRRLEELRMSGVTYALSALFKPKSIKKADDDSHKKFIYENEVLDLLEVIDGVKDDENLLSFLDYEKIKSGMMCRHIVCVLPYCASCDALESLIKNNAWKFKNLNQYEIINISGVENPNSYKTPKAIKDSIKKCESEGKKTITLTVNRMLTGSTVEEWDTMIYLKDTSSPQEYDQAIFRLQNQYVKTYIDVNGEVIKYNMKPQTLLVDFDPNRMFQMQEQKSQIYNVNVDVAGNSKLSERISEELRISPIIVMNKGKIEQITATDIMKAVSQYSRNRGVAEEANDIPVDLSLIDISDIWDVIGQENELGSKAGFETKAAEGEGNDINIPDPDNNSDVNNCDRDASSNDNTGNGTQDDNDTPKKDPAKQFRMYYARILYFAFLTKDTVISLDDIISCIDTENNTRIFNNLGLNKKVLIALKRNMDKFILRILDYKIQNLNQLSHDSTINPLERATIANQKFGKLGESQVVTPYKVCDAMIALLPEEFLKKCVKNKKRILDIASKEGEFAIALCKRYETLGYDRNAIKDIIYSIPTSSITYEFTRKIYEVLNLNIENIADKFNSYDILNIKTEANDIDYVKIRTLLNQDKKFNEITIDDKVAHGGEINMIKFGAVVGNPPYQEIVSKSSANKSLGRQLFPDFITVSIGISDKYVSLITPSKWFTGNGQDGSFPPLRSFAKENNHFEQIHHFGESKALFPDVELGAVNYFLYNKDYLGETIFVNYSDSEINTTKRPLFEDGIDIIISMNSMVSILKKVKTSPGFLSLTEITTGRNAFGITGNMANKISSEIPFEDAYELRCAHEVIRYVSEEAITRNKSIADKWKVFISKSNGGAGTLSDDKEVSILGKPYIGSPKSVCTDSLIPIGCFDTEVQAINLQKYLTTKFVRFMVGILKTSQNITQIVYKFVPMQDFSNNSDINWCEPISKIDAQLYSKYGLNKDEIAYIESRIKSVE
jgi:hypothetical protein